MRHLKPGAFPDDNDDNDEERLETTTNSQHQIASTRSTSQGERELNVNNVRNSPEYKASKSINGPEQQDLRVSPEPKVAQAQQKARVSTEPKTLSLWARSVEMFLFTTNIAAFVGGLFICFGLVDEGVLRTLMACLLTLLGPGSGLIQLVGRFDTTVKFVATIGSSVAISVLIAQLLLTFHSIGVLQAAIPLTIITGAGLGLRLNQLWSSSKQKRSEDS